MKIALTAALSLTALVFCAAPAGAQQPGTAAYNSVFLPAHGVGDTRSSGSSGRWGAVAASGVVSGAWVNASDQQEAENAALQQCRENGGGDDCALVTSYSNPCVAVASINSGESYPWAAAATMSEVRSMVRSRCARSGASCEIIYQYCRR